MQLEVESRYSAFKKQYADKIVLFRMGDFFETFGEDAKIASKVLNITLTKRDKKGEVPLAGFPYKAIDQYLPKFIEAGHCVVVVDQLEDPKQAKGIVKRGVIRVVTPGTLDGDEASSIKDAYLGAFFITNRKVYSSLCDISTGTFLLIVEENQKNTINSIISKYDPTEVLMIEGENEDVFSNIPVQFLEKGLKNVQYCSKLITEFFEVKNIDSLGLNEDEEVIPVAMILKYIQDTQLMEPKHIQKPRRVSLNSTMNLDRATIRNLELIANSYTGTVENSLFSILNKTSTRMGTRLLYSWILNPLISKKEIDERINTVGQFYKHEDILKNVREELDGINDIGRIAGRIGLKRATPRDVKSLQYSLSSSLNVLEKLRSELKITYNELDIKLFEEIIEKIEKAISDTPPTLLTEGGIIKQGYSKEVDELRSLSGDSKDWLKSFEEEERKKTNIPSLKVGFNSVFGYYIEVTKVHQDKVPERYIRKQTLVNSERYITEELKEKEEIILNAHDKLFELEYQLFNDLRDSLQPSLDQLLKLAETIANIDVLSNFAYVAIKNNYVKPEIYEIGEKDGIINIEKGRHPIVEAISEEEFISNDTFLSQKESNMAILTGPNMSGKSTYIRQVATIVLMAQIGSFVPASKAEISIADRIFTRVGASDDLAKGRSTFMVEMDEAANIVNNATKYSLIILDEVGRGTSTYDGVSIAWALAEYILKDIKARTLFATHYHELLKLAEKNQTAVKNYNVLVEEDIEKGTVIFLRKIVEGGTDRSYGIYVAKMAGLPERVVVRANEILESFEQKNMFSNKNAVREITLPSEKEEKANNQSAMQYPLFSAKESEIEREIQELDVDNLTPIEALNKIVKWRKQI
ncbi:MAG: DNA mismatch repair protein MutS [Candidatus Dojkabacteria bacterium]